VLADGVRSAYQAGVILFTRRHPAPAWVPHAAVEL
jgi:hypothetical protein